MISFNVVVMVLVITSFQIGKSNTQGNHTHKELSAHPNWSPAWLELTLPLEPWRTKTPDGKGCSKWVWGWWACMHIQLCFGTLGGPDRCLLGLRRARPRVPRFPHGYGGLRFWAQTVLWRNDTHTHIYIYIYIYINVRPRICSLVLDGANCHDAECNRALTIPSDSFVE